MTTNSTRATSANAPSVRWMAIRYLPAISVPLALIAFWQIYVTAADVRPSVLPAPSLILSSLWESREIAWGHTVATLTETAVGYGAALVFAVVMALVMDQIPFVQRSLYPLTVASQTIPVIAIAPLMIIWFGFGLLPKALVIALVGFFPVLVATLDGLASTDREATNLLQTMGANRWQRLWYLRIPGAVPSFFTGLRISAPYAIVGGIFAEYVGAYQGLGIWMQISQNAFRTDLVFAAILIASIVSIILFFIVSVVSRLAMPWYYAMRKESR